MKKAFGLFLGLTCSLTMALAVCSAVFITAQATDPEIQETRYAYDIIPLGGTLVNTQTRTIYYNHKTESTYINPYKAPAFVSTLLNACAVDAGGNAIVYFDRLFPDLIPDYSAKYVLGTYSYGTQNAAVNSMFSNLYKLMGTSSSGTTISGFKNGLSTYVTNQNQTAQIVSATGSYYNTNFEYIKAQLEQEKVGAIFLNNFSITSFMQFKSYDGYDYISHSVYTGNHTMLIYGYKDIYYYNATGNLIIRDTYFYASTGFNNDTLALINIRDFCKVDDIYIINVL